MTGMARRSWRSSARPRDRSRAARRRPGRDPRVRRRGRRSRRGDAGAAGELPNLAALRRRGGYSPLTSHDPRADPRLLGDLLDRAWIPGGHQIFDFLKRDPANRIPTFAVAEETEAPFLLGKSTPAVPRRRPRRSSSRSPRLLFLRRRRLVGCRPGVVGARRRRPALTSRRGPGFPRRGPRCTNNRRGDPSSGPSPGARPATVMRMPVTFPPEALRGGRLLSGLGRAGPLGPHRKAGLLHLRPVLRPPRGKRLLDRARPPRDPTSGSQPTRIVGPPGRLVRPRASPIDAPLTLTVSPARDRLTVDVGGTRRSSSTAGSVEPVGLPPLPRQPAHHGARIRAGSVWRAAQPEIALYLSPIQFDPERLPPGSPSRSPRGFADGARREVRPLQDDGLGDRHLVHPVRDAVGGGLSRRRAPRPSSRTAGCCTSLLAETERLLFHYFEFPDRVGPRVLEAARPAASRLRRRAGGPLRRRGRALVRDDGRDRRRDGGEALTPGTSSLVLSDHGFATLAPLGQLQHVARGERLPRPQGGRPPAEPRGALLAGAVLGGGGLVEVPGLLDGLRRHLRQSAGAGTGRHRCSGSRSTRPLARRARGGSGAGRPGRRQRAVSRVFKREDIYRRFDPRLIPDLIASNRPGLPRLVAVHPRGADGDACSRTTGTSGAATTARSIPTSCAASSSPHAPFRGEPVPGIADVTASVRALLGRASARDAAGKPLW